MKKIKETKEVKKNFVERIIYKEYIDVLFDENLTRHKMEWIQSKFHRTETYDVCKISLCCFVEKRYIINDGILLTVLLIFIKI